MCAACEGNLVPRGTGGAGGWSSTTTLADHIAPAPLLPKDDARRVDLIGWRIWKVTETGYLRSITAEAIWLPGEPMVAAQVDDNGAARNGVHVFKDRAGAITEMALYVSRAERSGGYALGTVQIVGDVVEHERGFRAEKAFVRSIDEVVWGNKVPWDTDTAKALAFLRERYGVGAHTEAPARGGDEPAE